MSYTDLRDFTPEYSRVFDTGCVVIVEKTGGGTLGQRYDGMWRYVVFHGGNIIAKGNDYYSGSPKLHRQVAAEVHEYFEEKGF